MFYEKKVEKRDAGVNSCMYQSLEPYRYYIVFYITSVSELL